MKKLYIQLLIALVFMGISQQNYAQINQRRSGEFQSIKGTGVTTGFPIFYDEDTFPNITFNGSQNSALNAHMAVIDAQIRAYDQWLKRQKDVFKDEIQKQLGQNFSDFEKAQKAFYRDFELDNVKKGATYLKKVYKNKTNLKKEIRSKCIANIKLLNLRATEISAGNINNSRYGHLKHGSTPISEIRSTSQVNNLITQETNEFNNNQWRLDQESKMHDFIKDMEVLNNRNHDILKDPSKLQINHYNSFNDWDKLDLMQIYIHHKYYLENPFLGTSKSIEIYGHDGYVEWYSTDRFPANLSVFHPNYWTTLPIYSTIPQLALEQAEKLRQDAINKALNEMSNPEFLTDVAIAGLGVRNEDFIKDDPDLNNEVRDYFKKNDFSKVASDCMNYLLNQLQDGGEFTPNTNLYKSLNAPLYQNAQNPNRVLNWQLGNQAVREGFTNFGNVLAALFKDNAYPGYEGHIIRDMFGINNLNVNAFILNEWLGNAFHFQINNGATVEIQYDNNNGTTIVNNNSSTNAYLNELVQGLNTKLNSSLTNDQKDWLFSHPQSIFDINKFLLTNNNAKGKAFAISAVKALIEGNIINYEELFIETKTPDDSYIYLGPKQLIPNPLILSDGTQININFGTTTSDNANANQPVATELINGIKFGIEQANNNLSASDQITSITIFATTNGKHGKISNHYSGAAVDISRINGKKMILSGVTNQIIELQKAFDNFTYIRENFGPHFKHKYVRSTDTWNYNYSVKGHKDHIHVSVRR